MAIHIASKRDDGSDLPREPEAALRRQVRLLTTDRDRERTRADELAESLERLREQHRHELVVRCDAANCRATCGVSTSQPTAGGGLAVAMLSVARGLNWELSGRTESALSALAGIAMLMNTREHDACPQHRAP